MAWASTPPDEPQELPREQLLRLESNWFSAQKELATWTRDLAACAYSLYLEAELDDDCTLYRFELDEDRRAEVRANAPHWCNVVLSRAENAKYGEPSFRDPKTGLVMSKPA